ARHPETADEPLLMNHRHRKDGTHTGVDEDLPDPALVHAGEPDVWDLDRLARDGRLADRAFPFSVTHTPERPGEVTCRFGDRPLDKLLRGVLILGHDAAVQTRELDGPRHDGGQHGFQI